MTDLGTQIRKARGAGYTDAQITAYLSKDKGMAPKVQQARKAGYSDAEIVAFLGGGSPKKTERKPNNPLEAVGKEVVGTFAGAWDKLKTGVKEDYARAQEQARTGKPGSMLDMSPARMAGDAGALALSPITGVYEALVVKPGAAVLDRIPATAYTEPTAKFEGGRLRFDGGRPMTGEERTAAHENAIRTALAGARPAPTKAPATPKPARRNALAETVEKFDRAGVEPSLAAAKGGGAAKVANMTAENIVGVRPRAQMARQVTQAGDKAQEIAAGYGQPTSTATLGESVKAGTKSFMAAPKSGAAPGGKTFGARSEALYERAEKLIATPDAPIKLTETTKALSAATKQFADPKLNARFSNPVLQGIADDVAAAGGQLSWRDAASLRTRIRTRLLADPALRATTDDAAVNSIYAALTDDLQKGARALGGPQAGRAYEQANRYYRAGMSRMDKALNSVFEASSGEQAYDRIIAAAGSGARADIRKISAVKRSLPPEQWGDLAATVIDRMGKPSAGAANAIDDGAFSVNTFLTNYAKLSPQGREVLFGSIAGGGKKAASLKAELDNLAEVVSMLKAVEKGANASNSGTAMQNFLAIAGAAFGGPGKIAAVEGGVFVAGEALTNPAVVRWLAKLGRASAAGPSAVRAQTAALSRAARTDAALRPLAVAAQQSLRMQGEQTPARSAVADEER